MSTPPRLPFSAQDLQQRYTAMRSNSKERFLSASFPRKLFEGPLNGGRFDIEYLPRTGKLKIYLKVFYNFVASTVSDDQIAKPIKGDDPTWYRKTWDDNEKTDWKAKFKSSSEQVWNSTNVRFFCTRPGWEDINCVPELIIEEALTAVASHYEVKVEKTVLKQMKKSFATANGSRQDIGAGWTRLKGRREEFVEGSNKEVKSGDVVKLEGRANVGQNYDPQTNQHVTTPVANLNQMDIQQRVGNQSCGGHLNAIAIENFATSAVDFDYNQMVRALTETNAGTLRFSKHTADLQGDCTVALKAFADRILLISRNPSSEALSSQIAFDLVISTDKSESWDLVNKRRTRVEQTLRQYGVQNPVRLKDKNRYMPHKHRPSHGVHIANGVSKWVDAVVMTIQDREEIAKVYSANYKYMTVPHEVGHMLGLMDEYAPTEDGLLIRLMAESGVIPRQNIQDLPCKRDKDADRMWARLLQQFDLVTPYHHVKLNGRKVGYSPDRQSESSFQAATTSLMSAGFNVAPQHFVIIGLALQEYTEDYTTWDLEQQFHELLANSAWQSSKKKFMWRIGRQ